MKNLVMTMAALVTLASCGVYAGPQKIEEHPGMMKAMSAHDYADTRTRLKTILADKGLTLFSEIDHGSGADAVDMDLTPSTLFVFGDPKAGTPLMQSDEMMAFELPLRILVQKRDDGVWLIYRNAKAWSDEYDLIGLNDNLARIDDAVTDIVETVISEPEEQA